ASPPVSLARRVPRFDGRDGLPSGSIEAIARHAGRIVVAAGGGLYALSDATFEKLPAAVPRPHDLIVFGGWLFASGSGGVWRIDNGHATPVASLPGGVTAPAPWGGGRGVLLAARTTGLTVLRLLGDRLVEVRSFGDLGEIRSIAEDDKGA